MGYSLNTVSTFLTIYGQLSFEVSRFARLLFRLASLSAFHKGIDSQAKWKLLPGFQFHQRLQNFGVHVFRRLVRPNVLFSENSPHADHVAPEFMRPIRLGSHIRTP